MPPATHALAGWCFGNLLRLTPRERAWCIGISLLPDLDGLSLLGGVSAYQTYHHVLTHNLTFCALAVSVIAVANRCSLRATTMLVALFHLHLLMDFFGSGPGWGLSYLWPWNGRSFSTLLAWQFGGWQNWLTFAVFTTWIVFIALRYRRTPCEYIAPRFERFLLGKLPQPRI